MQKELKFYDEIKPTVVMVKRHNVTGMLYFHKTWKLDKIDSYNGSGPYWLKHLKENGYEWTNIWISEIFYGEQIVEFAIDFSILHNIVSSPLWANKIYETGLGGTDCSQMNTPEIIEKRNRTLKTKECRNRIGASVSKTRTEEYRMRVSQWSKKAWEDPDYRAMQIEHLKKRKLSNSTKSKIGSANSIAIKTPDKIFKSLTEASEFYGVSISTIYRWIKKKNDWNYYNI